MGESTLIAYWLERLNVECKNVRYQTDGENESTSQLPKNNF